MAHGNFSPHDFADLSEVELDHRYRLLIDAVEDYAIFMLDRSGNVASWNPGAQRAKGYSPDEILGRHFSVFYTDEDSRTGKPARLLAAARDHGRAEDEGWRVRKNGSRFWANVVMTAVRNEGGDLVGYAKITRDLTESRRLNELERVAADSALVQSAREDEKKHIARELHDDLGQRISALKMTLALHETDISQYVPMNVTDRLTGIHELAAQLDAMATAIRRIAADLSPRALAQYRMSAVGIARGEEIGEGAPYSSCPCLGPEYTDRSAAENAMRHTVQCQIHVCETRVAQHGCNRLVLEEIEWAGITPHAFAAGIWHARCAQGEASYETRRGAGLRRGRRHCPPCRAGVPSRACDVLEAYAFPRASRRQLPFHRAESSLAD